MSEHSDIQWTDATWNPTTGCTKVSPGCAHCYIERTPPFRIKGRKFANGHIPVQLHPDRLQQPLHWKKPRRVFVNSLSDLFHESVPDAFIDQVFGLMALTPQHTYQVLTKRAERMREYSTRLMADAAEDRGKDVPHRIACAMPTGKYGQDTSNAHFRTWPLDNVWLGVSVENQHFADERIPLLLQTPAAVRFISAEPLLGHVDVRKYLSAHARDRWEAEAMEMGSARRGPFLDWVIVGGESGPGSRPCDLAWVRSIVEQCQAAGVACFVKQLGAHVQISTSPLDEWEAAHAAVRSGHQARISIGLRAKKGGDPAEWPADLRVRQFPKTGVPA